MTKYLDFTLDDMDAEFSGKPWNGKSLMATLERLSAAEAASGQTWEGYSAWSIALHCAKCKRLVVVDLGVPQALWPYPDALWFPDPAETSEEAWVRDRALLTEYHEASMKALRAFPESRLGEEMPTWEAPWGKVLAWLATHDAFHGAQIRSMGLPSLKSRKHE
jgi:hypothetical protein